MQGISGEADMYMRMAKRRSGVLLGTAGLVSVAMLVAGCGGSGGSAPSAASHPDYLAAVTRAAYTTEQVPGYKFAITTRTQFGDKDVTVQGGGAISDGGSQGTASLELEGKKIDEVIDKPYLYVSTPPGAKSDVTHGKPWLRAELSSLSQSLGSSSFGGGSSNPSEMLSYLRAAGTVTRTGEEDVRGVNATRYHAVIDFGRFAAAVPPDERAAARRGGQLLQRMTGAKSLPMDVWVGAGRVRRVAMSMSLCTPEGRLRESISLDLYDYGRQPAPSPPPADQVADVGAQVKDEVQKSLAQLSCG
jgi:hypothetical protein